MDIRFVVFVFVWSIFLRSCLVCFKYLACVSISWSCFIFFFLSTGFCKILLLVGPTNVILNVVDFFYFDKPRPLKKQQQKSWMDQTNLALERRKIHHRRPKNRRFWDFGVPLGDPLAALVAVAVMAVLVTVRRKRAGALLIHSNYSNRPGGIPAPLPRSSVHQVRRRPLHSVRQITNDKERNQQKKTTKRETSYSKKSVI